MDKELYDHIIKEGYEVLNYPPKIYQTEPSFVKIKNKYNIYHIPINMTLEEFKKLFSKQTQLNDFLESLKNRFFLIDLNDCKILVHVTDIENSRATCVRINTFNTHEIHFSNNEYTPYNSLLYDEKNIKLKQNVTEITETTFAEIKTKGLELISEFYVLLKRIMNENN